MKTVPQFDYIGSPRLNGLAMTSTVHYELFGWIATGRCPRNDDGSEWIVGRSRGIEYEGRTFKTHYSN